MIRNNVPSVNVHQKFGRWTGRRQSMMRSKRNPTFNTVKREKSFRNPPQNVSTYPFSMYKIVTPHIESFNALFDDSGLPKPTGVAKGYSLRVGLGCRCVWHSMTGQPGTENQTE